VDPVTRFAGRAFKVDGMILTGGVAPAPTPGFITPAPARSRGKEA